MCFNMISGYDENIKISSFKRAVKIHIKLFSFTYAKITGSNQLHMTVSFVLCCLNSIIEPRRDKTGLLHMRKQRRRSASR